MCIVFSRLETKTSYNIAYKGATMHTALFREFRSEIVQLSVYAGYTLPCTTLHAACY